jgi:hypothetical protein
MTEINPALNIQLEVSMSQGQPYSIFPKWQRVTYVYIASLAAFSSPVSSNIYLPAMLSLATELQVSLTKISLTITMYMVSSTFSQSEASVIEIYTPSFRSSKASLQP